MQADILHLWFNLQRKKAPYVKKDKTLSYQTLKIKDHERKQLHEHFHLATEDINLEAWAEKSSCILCHSPYPHGKESKAKALMNLHTEFLTCHSCHIHIDEGEKIKFGWINPLRSLHLKGEPYGTKLDPATGTLYRDR